MMVVTNAVALTFYFNAFFRPMQYLTIALHSITKQSGEINEFCNRGKYVGIRRIPYSKCFPSLRVRNELVQI